MLCVFFFFNDTATTEIYTLSLHDALPISGRRWAPSGGAGTAGALAGARVLPGARGHRERHHGRPGPGPRILTRLAECGVMLSIDDFGAGHTSLAQPKDLPVHQLGIDRSFIAPMTADPSNALTVRSVVELGHDRGLTTVAEGVEDAATRDTRATWAATWGRGYHVCRPMAADQLEAWSDATVAVRA